MVTRWYEEVVSHCDEFYCGKKVVRQDSDFLKSYHVWRLLWPHLQRSRATWRRLLWWKLHRSLSHVVRLLCKYGKRSLRHVIRLLCEYGKTSLPHVRWLLCFSFHTSSLNREFQCNAVARFFILSHQMYISIVVRTVITFTSFIVS